MPRKSQLKDHPKSKIVETGYINVYSKLTAQEKRQLNFTRLYKFINPAWDNTTILLNNLFRSLLPKTPHNNQQFIVLDAGCGNGNYVIDENRHAIDWASGVDIDKVSTQKNICLDEIKYSSLSRIPYPDNYFDVVISLWVIEHLPKPKEVYPEIYRVLKPGGYFLFSTPNKTSFIVRVNQIVKYLKLNKIINQLLFGRNEEDIFPIYYRSNTKNQLSSDLVSLGFIKERLILNYDPGYTSFNKITFYTSNIIDRICSNLIPGFTKPHIIGLFKK